MPTVIFSFKNIANAEKFQNKLTLDTALHIPAFINDHHTSLQQSGVNKLSFNRQRSVIKYSSIKLQESSSLE